MERRTTIAPTLEGDVEQVYAHRRTIVGVRRTVRPRALRDHCRLTLPVLASALRRGGLEPSGPSVAIIRPDDTGGFQVTVGSPVRWCPATGPPLVHDRTPEGPAVQLTHFGAPDTLLATYDRLNEWLTARRIPPVPLMWEEYLVSGAATDDAAAWRTRIVLPLPPHAAGGSRPDGP
jgi:hypothetical protein